MPYRIKLAVKVPGDPAVSRRRRELVQALIGARGGKDVSPARPAAKYVAAVFSTVTAAKAFRENARQKLRESA